MSEIDFEQGRYGPKATIKVRWNDSLLPLLLKRDTRELELNIGKGWRGECLDFLKELPHLWALSILDDPLKSIQPIHYLHELIDLHLETYSDVSVDFGAFPKLTHCWFEWIKGSESLFDCKNLISLGINNYGKKSSEPFSNLTQLERLTLLNSKVVDLSGVFPLTRLKYVRVANLRRVESIHGIQNLKNLAELEINRCMALDSVAEIFKLDKLKSLFLIDLGNIDTLHGIENLSELKKFIFYGSTNIVDGDLSPILRLKNLSKISFKNRRHYSQRLEDFGH